MPPAILDLRIAPAASRSHHLWLPIFLLWPLLLIVAVIVFPVTLLVDAVLLVAGRPYHHYTILTARLFGLLGETRGMVVRINDGKTAVDMTVK